MKRKYKQEFCLVGVLLSLISLVFSCNLDDELMECPYNVQLEYWYTMEGTNKNNMVENYIYKVTEYIFDGNDILYGINTLPGNSARGSFFSEMTLPEGKYTVVSWANTGVEDHEPQPKMGITTKEELLLHLGKTTHNPALLKISDDPARVEGNVPRIYYGYASFSVEDKKISRIRVGITHAYCLLNVIVKWATTAPANTRNFRLQLRDIPGIYYSVPEYVDGQFIPPDRTVDTYPITSEDNARLYLPGIEAEKGLKQHQIDVSMDITRSLRGEFVTHRYANDTHPKFSVFAGDEQITKEIDLQKFFQTKQIDLDTNLRQEFYIIVEIHENQILVSSAIYSDWENGGVIGGQL